MEFRLDVYSHYVKVTGFNKLGKDVLLDFCRPLAQYGVIRTAYGQFQRKMLRIFAAATRDRTEFRFHIHQVDELIHHLKLQAMGEPSIKIFHHLPTDGKAIVFKVNEKYILRDYQVPILEYLLNSQKVNVLTLQTGRGKTLMGFKAVEGLKERALLVVKGQYVEQWVLNFNESIDCKPGDLMVVRGSKHLIRLIELAQCGELEAKFIIITNKTMYNYIADYELKRGVDSEYPCTPDEFCRIVGIGVRLIDEAHQLFHMNFRLDLYTHVKKTINLSATLQSSDPFKNKMYKIAYPMQLRFQGAEYIKYINAKALSYQLNEPGSLRCTAKGRGTYSHMEFEKSILKNPVALENYIKMIAWIVKEEFIHSRQPGMKMLIFAASIKLCTILAERFKEIWPDLNVQRYVEDDDYHAMLKGDILVSTLLSSGTAIDIPGLYVSLMTTALGSRELNEQALGRTRELKDYPEVKPKFLYLVCDSIPKHIDYHIQKKEYFKDKVLSHQDLSLPFRI